MVVARPLYLYVAMACRAVVQFLTVTGNCPRRHCTWLAQAGVVTFQLWLVTSGVWLCEGICLRVYSKLNGLK